MVIKHIPSDVLVVQTSRPLIPDKMATPGSTHGAMIQGIPSQSHFSRTSNSFHCTKLHDLGLKMMVTSFTKLLYIIIETETMDRQHSLKKNHVSHQ